ncbi:hypothetical protein MK851_15405 [Tenacibaculum sp. 1B UA]|uniref:hypothetical protein n=1 Tax=Tenacibaculum sp. 1B UA TaxID=2922252 RepID=UPI002A239BE9|nr:hypothetical protein [Tenacibaculum sp. 1B UA]MDX8555001.1 hypothetical protein [Tenacibaculum sp. 1B UA]
MMRIIIILSIALCFQSCVSQTKEEKMEEYLNELYKNITVFKERPVYGVQINKTGCKLVIEFEGSIDYRLTENNGESMMLPLNGIIIKSGVQTATIRIYPKDGEDLVTKYAHVKLRFTEAPDKKSGLNEYKTIATFESPTNIGELKLPYYESKVTFTANVPFDYSKELDQAKDLKTIKDIENKVVAKYNSIIKLGEQFDEVGYLKEQMHSKIIHYSSGYFTGKEEIKEGHEVRYALTDERVYNREILPVENYIMQFYADNKIVALWQKNNNPMIYIKGNYKYEDGEEAYAEGGDPIFLYMPKGSKELKIW